MRAHTARAASAVSWINLSPEQRRAIGAELLQMRRNGWSWKALAGAYARSLRSLKRYVKEAANAELAQMPSSTTPASERIASGRRL